MNTYNRKIIVASVACDREYGPAVQASRETCYKNIPSNMSVYFLYGHRDGIDIERNQQKVIGNDFYCDFIESKENMTFKTIEFYDWCLENLDFDYIYRVSGNCYYDLDLLNSCVEEMNIPYSKAWYCHNEFPAGGPNHLCAGGIGLLSRDLIAHIVKQKHRLISSFFHGPHQDDAAMGRLLCAEQGICPKRLENPEVHISPKDINEKTIDDKSIMYRFRQTNNPECFYKIYDIKNDS